MKLNKKSVNKFLEYIIVLLVALESTSVYSNSNILPVGILTLLSIFTGIYAILNIENILSINKKKLGIYFIYILYIIILMIASVSVENYFNFIIKYFFIISVFYFNIKSSYDLKRYLTYYCNIIFSLCCLSLILYTLGYICNLLPINYSVILNWGNTKIIGSIFNLHFLIQTESFLGTTLIRNTGVFCEAPMYMLNLVLCLTLALFYIKKSKITILILILGIITTFSSTGYIILVILLFLYFIFNKKMNLKILIIPIILVSAFFTISNIIESKSSTRSYSVRYDDYMASIKAWQKNIIFGNGYKQNEEFLNNISTFRDTNTGQSSSIGAVLSQGGLFMLTLYFISFLEIYKFNERSKCFAIVYLVLFVLVVFQYTAIELFILSISINLKNLK